MRIAVITSSYPRFEGDGAAPFVQSICEAFVKAGHDVEVIAPYDELVRPMETNGVKLRRFHYAPFKSWHILGHARSLEADVRLRPLAILLLPFFLAAAFWQLWKITGWQKSQVVYAHWVIPNGLPAAVVAGFRHIPMMISLHGSDIFLAGSNFLYRAVAGWVFRRAAVVTACSPDLRQRAIEMGAPGTTELLAWGADPNLFRPLAGKESVRQRYGFSGQDIILTALGRMVYKKGFEVLLRAFQPIVAACPQAKLVVGGDGPLNQPLHQLASKLGIEDSVAFPGKIAWDQVPQFLGMADIFVLPSVRDQKGNMDGLPTVLLEAMGCGLTVVASDIGGVRLAVDDGVNGLVVPPGDAAALGSSLSRLIAGLATRLVLGQRARQSVVERLNWQTVSARLIALVEPFVERAGMNR
jgi:glycosyltransferase involved in cell wall biosynthesis